MALSNEGILRSGLTKVCLNLPWMTLSEGYMFMVLVIGVRTSRHLMMIMKVWQGSKSQDLVGHLDISFLTSFSVNEWKERSGRRVDFSLTLSSKTLLF